LDNKRFLALKSWSA